MRTIKSSLVVAVALAVGLTTPASAKVYADQDPTAVANTFFRAQDLERRAFDADFVVRPPSGHPTGYSTSRLAHFPRRGTHFAILSTGNVRFADDKDTSGYKGANNHGPVLRGVRDLVMMRVRFVAPKNAHCMYLPFKFLSEEFPEFVNDVYNDAFIAELDGSTWDSPRADPELDYAPRNFARDSLGHPISINAVGDARVRSRYAKGTTYDAATRTLRAATPITPGRHTLYLSIFDQGDRQYDSAVFLDKLRFRRSAKNCDTGVVVDKR